MTVHRPTPNPISSTARSILAARFWRSIAQGALVVDLALYLSALGWSGTAIGGVLSGAGLAGAAFGLAIGFVSDRFGRKNFLLLYEAVGCVCGLAAFFTSNTPLLTAAIVLGGFGRGANGAAGPFAPAEDAWLAESVEPIERGYMFSVKSSVGFAGMALGALAAMLPALWSAALGPAASHRPLFLVVVLGNAANLFILGKATERKRAPPPAGDEARPKPAEETRGHENRFLFRLMAINALNGLAVGLTGPLMSYWFQQRFRVGAELIAPVMAGTFFAVAVVAQLTGGLGRRSGMVNVLLWTRWGGLGLLLILPLMPVYALAALVHLLRTALISGTIGTRQALVVSAVRDERRGVASSLNTFSGRLPQSIGPALAGSFIGAGWFMTPFYLGAVFQGAYI
ncbi:MAG TPA: MFS transporter, partial [Candidatus Saccharimonadales bacterium]|nr:MFS transporter [Candidatus Saccharimonadales bacterium]